MQGNTDPVDHVLAAEITEIIIKVKLHCFSTTMEPVLHACCNMVLGSGDHHHLEGASVPVACDQQLVPLDLYGCDVQRCFASDQVSILPCTGATIRRGHQDQLGRSAEEAPLRLARNSAPLGPHRQHAGHCAKGGRHDGKACSVPTMLILVAVVLCPPAQYSFKPA